MRSQWPGFNYVVCHADVRLSAMCVKGETSASQVGICLGPRCGDYGGRDLLAALQARGIRAQGIDCQSLCQASPVVRLPDHCLLRASLEDVLQEVV